MQNCDGIPCYGLNSKLVKSCEWTNCGTRRYHSTFRCGRGWKPCSASDGSESRCERSGDFFFTGRAACFLTAQSHHRYPQVVHRTLCDDNLNSDNDCMYTVTICRCLVVQTQCKRSLFSSFVVGNKLSLDTVHAHCAHTLQSW